MVCPPHPGTPPRPAHYRLGGPWPGTVLNLLRPPCPVGFSLAGTHPRASALPIRTAFWRVPSYPCRTGPPRRRAFFRLRNDFRRRRLLALTVHTPRSRPLPVARSPPALPQRPAGLLCRNASRLRALAIWTGLQPTPHSNLRMGCSHRPGPPRAVPRRRRVWFGLTERLALACIVCWDEGLPQGLRLKPNDAQTRWRSPFVGGFIS